MTGEIDTRVRVRNPLFMCPEGCCDFYEAFMEYLRQKELASSAVRNYRETVQQFIRHMISIGIESSEMISSVDILSFPWHLSIFRPILFPILSPESGSIYHSFSAVDSKMRISLRSYRR